MNDRSCIFDEPSRPTKRAAKERERAFRLVDVARDLFSKHGYDCVSVKQIAEAAGMAQGSLYNYFANKEDLYWAVLTRHGYVSHAQEIIESADGKPARDVLLEIALRFHQYLSENKEMLRLVLAGSQTNPEVAKLFADYVETHGAVMREFVRRRIDAGELRQHDVRASMHMLMSTVVHYHAFDLPATDDYPAYLTEVVEIVMSGLRPARAGE